MDDLVERVARAIHDAQCSCGTWREPSDEWRRRGLLSAWCADHYHTPGQIEREWVDAARAAIEAMRAPTKAMIEAGADCVMNDQLVVKVVWHKMIDEALGPTRGTPA